MPYAPVSMHSILLPPSQPLRSAAAYIRGTHLAPSAWRSLPALTPSSTSPSTQLNGHLSHTHSAQVLIRVSSRVQLGMPYVFSGSFQHHRVRSPSRTTNHQTHDPRSYKQTKNRYVGFVSGFRGRMNLIHVPVLRRS
ncbi:hypothetical protein B0H13DRAFT_2346275 [Mycena leptocephala]|nr:hypothetical protein B0H13DRAFT_2346275 [Mycena leptocephala]